MYPELVYFDESNGSSPSCPGILLEIVIWSPMSGVFDDLQAERFLLFSSGLSANQSLDMPIFDIILETTDGFEGKEGDDGPVQILLDICRVFGD